MQTKKAMLVILDGWGLGERPEADAIHRAKTPYFDHLMSEFPNATLTTFGTEVGLPKGQMGNSEVGHLNIGAGRVVYQELARINKAIEEDTLAQMSAIQRMIQYAKDQNKPIHLMGLLSDGGVHSHIDHLIAICHIISTAGISKIYIHAFMDGRDTDPQGGKKYLSKLLKEIEGTNAKVATVIGRYYAMDRDMRWERIKKAYDLIVLGKGEQTEDVLASLQDSYDDGTTDEFIKPILAHKEGLIKENDAVCFFNFRTDRPRQLVKALTQEKIAEYGMSNLPLHMVTMVNYDQSFKDIDVIYEKDNLEETLGEVIERNGLSQVRIAETEKYPHVTFFFNGGRELPFEREERILIPSPKVATYDMAPEMSAKSITDAICKKMDDDAPDFICLNYANADMVGHTGNFNAAMEACEFVDQCLKVLVQKGLIHDYEIIIIADHGNSDMMINEDGSPNTAHTTNLVPIIYISNSKDTIDLKNGKLADIAPTLLSLMNVPKSALMTGEDLISIH